eukprot:scaffold7210_cov63-Attheya_sp.AAC.5
MPADVIERIHNLACRAKAERGFSVADHNGIPLIEDDNDDSDDEGSDDDSDAENNYDDEFHIAHRSEFQ